ncbi:acyltransferase family protein [Agarilytica rhodophyticola]|uniref:acyltransferase family protein n=1 Tax=Agarilytica rhodophyticola TaxID=1737490 RepID=UPI001319CF50|nr:acyltransferase [Agarilytica rhodophyticola]
MDSRDKYLSVESIRGLACVMVLMSHLSLTFFPFLHAFDGKGDIALNSIQGFIHESPFGFFYSGSAAVYIFFVLSGFILTKVALKKDDAPVKIFSMFLKRYPRLMIPVLVSCIIAYVFFQLFDISSPDLGPWIKGYGSLDYSLTNAIYSGTVDVFFLSGYSAYNPVLWTMKIELLGSIVVYLLCLNKVTLKLPFLLEVVALLTVILTFLKIIPSSLGSGLFAFYGGYLFCIYGRVIPLKIALPVLLFGLFLAGAHNQSYSYSLIATLLGTKTYSLCNFMSGFFVVYAIIFNDKLNMFFSGKALVFMGKVSFSVYLIHMPILSTFGIYAFNILFQYTGVYHWAAVGTSLLTILSVYLCSIMFYRYVDAQGMNFSNFFANKIITQLQAVKKTAQGSIS